MYQIKIKWWCTDFFETKTFDIVALKNGKNEKDFSSISNMMDGFPNTAESTKSCNFCLNSADN